MELILFYIKLGSFRLRSWPSILMAVAMGYIATRTAPHFHLAIMFATYGLVSMDGAGLLTRLSDKSMVGTLPVTIAAVIAARWVLATIAAVPITLPFFVGMAVGGGQGGTLMIAVGLGLLMTLAAAALSLVGWRFSAVPKLLVALMAISFLIGQSRVVLPQWIQSIVQQWWLSATSHISEAMWLGNLMLILASLVIAWVSYPRKGDAKTVPVAALHVSTSLPVEWNVVYAAAISNASMRYFIGILTLPLMVAFIAWNTTRTLNPPTYVISILSLLVGSTGVVPAMGMMAMTVLGYQKDGIWFHQLPVSKHRVILMAALGISGIGLVAGVLGDCLWAILWEQWTVWIPALWSTIAAALGTSLWLMVVAFRFFRRDTLASIFHISSVFRGATAVTWDLVVITVIVLCGPNHLATVSLALLVSACVAASIGYVTCTYQYERWT